MQQIQMIEMNAAAELPEGPNDDQVNLSSNHKMEDTSSDGKSNSDDDQQMNED